MKIFIAWSADQSKAVAVALRGWLPKVIQAAKPWMSAHDIDSGARWRDEISGQLKDAGFGIVCLTPANIASPWLHFEAGALAKSVEESRVVPYLMQLRPADVKDPLAQFQLREASKEGTRRLVETINSHLTECVKPDDLAELYDALWPKLETEIKAAESLKSEPTPKRGADEILEEILEKVRRLTEAFEFAREQQRLIKEQEFAATKTFVSELLTHKRKKERNDFLDNLLWNREDEPPAGAPVKKP